MKDAVTYEHVPPESIGNKRRVLVSDLSGQSNVRYKAEEMGINVGDRQDARKVADRIKELEHLGSEFEGAEADLKRMKARSRWRVETGAIDHTRIRANTTIFRCRWTGFLKTGVAAAMQRKVPAD